MCVLEDMQLMRIFIGDSDRHDHKPLYEAIIHAAHEQQLVGATAIRGYMGFGAHRRIHTAKVVRLSESLPVVVEIVDSPEKIQAFLPVLDALTDEALVMIQPAKVRRCRYQDHSAMP
jgi:PII-like signaling protein